MKPGILIYHFTESEEKEWELALKPVPGMWRRFVREADFRIPIRELVRREENDGVPSKTEEEGHRMIVIVHAEGKILEYLLAVCRMITDQPVFRAVLTEANQEWTSVELIEHLAEEERQIEAWKAAQKKQEESEP